jgi:tRNA A-37 threonylcarbamoyl transferase component Bud32
MASPGNQDRLTGPAGCLTEEQVWPYLSGLVDRDADARLQEHVDRCPACARVLAESLRAIAGGEPEEAGAAPSGPFTLRPGEVILDRYRVNRFVARGGMGEVYEACDLVLDETIALKTLLSTKLDKAAALDRFLAEVRAARRVTHPNVCRILEFGFHRSTSTEGRVAQIPFLTMEFLHGETLSRRIARQGKLEAAEVAVMLPQIVAGLSAIHAAGIVHRDIKPQNLVVLPGLPERLVVTDFGVARSLDPDPGRHSTTGAFVVGTIDYMAPEQLEGRAAATSFDIYALGVVVFEMLTGRRPWGAESSLSTAVERFSRAPPRPSQLVPGLDPAWDHLVERCLAREPQHRYARVEEIRPPRRRRLGRRGRLLLLAVGVAAVALAGVIGKSLHRPDGTAAIGADPAALAAVLASRPPGAPPPRPHQRIFLATGCSEDMVAVAGKLCIDRFEAATVDDVAERPLSPFYPPWAPMARSLQDHWRRRLREGASGFGANLPALPDFELVDAWRPRAVSTIASRPQAYLSRPMAAAACASAGKRLCAESEWRLACRGEKGTRFPYGAGFRDGMCNVARASSGAADPHGAMGEPRTDPRLNQAGAPGRDGLQDTGAGWRCRSQWGPDFVYDMVGNLDEWVDGPDPALAGGHFGHDVGAGCEHRRDRRAERAYYDHSTGFRCCDSLRPVAPPPATPGFEVAVEGSGAYPARTDFDGFTSDSAIPADVFRGRPVLFKGYLYGGSQEQRAGGAAFLVYRFRLTFPAPVRIVAISVRGAGDFREDSQIRLLDGQGQVQAAVTTRGFKTVTTTSLRPPNATGSTFVFEEYDHSGRYRYRSRIDVVAEPLRR